MLVQGGDSQEGVPVMQDDVHHRVPQQPRVAQVQGSTLHGLIVQGVHRPQADAI